MDLMDLKKLPKTRKEAIEKGERFFYTGKLCSRGHLSKRSVLRTHCVRCDRDNNARWRENNREKYNAGQKIANARWREIDFVFRPLA